MAINIPQPQEDSTEVKLWRMGLRFAAISVLTISGCTAHWNYVDYLAVEAGIAKGFSPAEARCAINASQNGKESVCVIFAAKK